jgi:hypothetical protein
MTQQNESSQHVDQDPDYLNKFHEDELLTKIKNIASEGTLEIEDQRTARITRTLLWFAKLLTGIFKRERMRSDATLKLAKELNDLSKKSEAQTRKLISLTHWLIGWTIFLAFLTLFLILKDFDVFTKRTVQTNKGINNATQNDKK